MATSSTKYNSMGHRHHRSTSKTVLILENFACDNNLTGESHNNNNNKNNNRNAMRASGGKKSGHKNQSYKAENLNYASTEPDTSSSTSGAAAPSSNGRIFIPKSRINHKDLEDAEESDTDNIMSPSEDTPLRSTNGEYHREYGKTFLAIFSVFISTTMGAFAIAYIHKFSVLQKAPLPDLVFELVPEQEWAWEVADVSVMLCPLFGFFVLLFHKHNSIVFRRFASTAAFLYILRAVFLVCTYLPPPFTDFKDRCLPANFSDNTLDLFVNAFGLVFKAGFSYDQGRFMCGDTIFSGHAMVFTLVCLFVRYYTPRAVHPYPAILVIAGSTLGICCVLISRQHYSIDVAVAVLATCAVFYGHERWTMRRRDRCCFSAKPVRFRPVLRLFLFLEHRTPPGALPHDLAWPLPWPGAACRALERWNERTLSESQQHVAATQQDLGNSTVGQNLQPPPFDV